MFHVKQTLETMINTRNLGSIKIFFQLAVLSLVLLCCSSIPQGNYFIDDYLVVPTQASNSAGSKNLNVFVFENDLSTPPIELYLANRFALDNYQTREFWVETSTKDRLFVKLLDKSETEKYLDLSQYAANIQETKGNRDLSQCKYLAFAVTDERGDDALRNNSLYYQIATHYLKKLKDDYLRK